MSDAHKDWRERVLREKDRLVKSLFTSDRQQRTCSHMWTLKWYPDRTYEKYCTKCGKVSGT